mgnify:FL=1
MKYTKHIGLILTISLVLACNDDFLEPVPENVISSENYFLNDDQIESGVIGIYDAIQGINSTSTNDNRGVQQEFYVTEMRSDNTRTKNQEGEAAQFESYAVTPNNGIVENYYKST